MECKILEDVEMNCSKCNRETAGSRKYCDECRLDLLRIRELNNTRGRMIRNRNFMKEYKQTRGCDICGYAQCSYALDFHHIDPKTKLDTVCNLSKKLKNLEIIKSEIDKCKLICANCHREQRYKDKIIKSIPPTTFTQLNSHGGQ